MKLTRDKNARPEQRQNTKRLDDFQKDKSMEDLQVSPNKNIKSGRAGYIYKKLAKVLREQGFVKNIDINLVNLLAIHIDIYYQAYEEITKHGIQQAIYGVEQTNDGQVIDEHRFKGFKKNPAIDTLNASTNQIKTLSEKLGLSPASRASMLANIKQEDDSEPSIADILGKDVGF